MRTQQEMMELILGVAEGDERIRAVYMNGSRTNPNVPKDIFQDYDIVYVVKETLSFIRNEGWIQVFGELLMLQEPDKNDQSLGMEMDFERSYGYLMLFKDGNRIDLRIQTVKDTLRVFGNDSLTIPLLDKDGVLPNILPATDLDYHVRKPSEAEFFSCCNDFWWCMQNVAKGIWRDELPYTKQMFELVIRPRLDEMVSWWIGMNHDFAVAAGKMGKYFKNFLPMDYWNMYESSYSGSNDNEIWDSVFITCELFRKLGNEVARRLTFTYPDKDDENMTNYLQQVRELPSDAKKIF